jgi:hypothetical protein
VARGVPTTCKDANGLMPLHAAVAGGHLGLVHKLVAMGVPLHIEDLRKRTALHWAACTKQSHKTEPIRFILSCAHISSFAFSADGTTERSVHLSRTIGRVLDETPLTPFGTFPRLPCVRLRAHGVLIVSRCPC